MNVTCPKNQCKTILSSSCVFYEGESLLYTGIKTNDPIEIVIQKLNRYLQDNPGGGGGGAINTVTNYRSNFELDGWVYAGYLLNSTPVITKTIDGVLLTAQNVTDLEADWTNRLSLIYI